MTAEEGLVSCPQCGASTVTVSAMVWVKVDRDHEHDTAAGSGYSYGDESPAVCRECGHRGRLIDFDPQGRDETADSCECDSAFVPGTIYMPVEGTVERCDLCARFPGDLEAALAVSAKVGQPAWALMEHPGHVFQIERVTAELCAGTAGHWITEGTDPWIGDWREGLDFAGDDRIVWPTLADEQAWRVLAEDRSPVETAVANEFGAWAERNGIT